MVKRQKIIQVNIREIGCDQEKGIEREYVHLDKQEIERNSSGWKIDKNRYRWIDEDQAEVNKMRLKEIGVNLYRQRDIKKQRQIDKRQKQIQVHIQR